jgi:hypothetical protein
VDDSQSATFNVEFEATPKPVVKWFRYTFPISQSDEILMESDDKSATLCVKKTCLDDSGIFTCLLENLAGATKSSTNLTVLEVENQQVENSQFKNRQDHSQVESQSVTTSEEHQQQSSTQQTTTSQSQSYQSQSHQSQSQQSIISNSRTMHVKKDDKIRIDIQFVDGNKSDLTFTHNDQPLSESNKDGITITFKDDIATLTIDHANENHTGTYECIMKTEGGQARCKVDCQVD